MWCFYGFSDEACNLGSMSWLLVFLGGGLGSVARFGISWLILKNYEGHLPLATFISNLLACFLLAIVVTNSFEPFDNRVLKYAVLVGFCGGFSTFSTFSFETIELIKNGNHLVAVGNVIVSVAVCLILLYKLTK